MLIKRAHKGIGVIFGSCSYQKLNQTLFFFFYALLQYFHLIFNGNTTIQTDTHLILTFHTVFFFIQIYTSWRLKKIKMAALTENVINKILTEERFYFALKLEQLKVIECIVKKETHLMYCPQILGKACYSILSIMHLKNIISP